MEGYASISQDRHGKPLLPLMKTNLEIPGDLIHRIDSNEL